ncbi:iron-containing redox enzyme family protein [Nocardiaceae bacterium YC2-7]|uniref:Iron-containing redox enzyme family protein n=2 Tax=Antrihabitans stalactiti TaxID=2584121 RepID=A0A848KAJ5_9NOCA|nr:iron-containing redox enzyme family protein [Antrihabitans stalactiti]
MKPFGTSMSPHLPRPRGPISRAVIRALATRKPGDVTFATPPEHIDPFSADVQVALTACYELHYRGFEGVDADWEWDPQLIGLRSALEKPFLARLRAEVGPRDDIDATLDSLCIEPADGEGFSYYLRDVGTWENFREYFVHRSMYHLKEADPHAWVIPRLTGRAKAGIVAVEFDEFGGGRADRIHSQLFADLMRAADLEPAYLAYVDSASAEALAVVNFMSMCGLRRGLRGAIVGILAAAEITSSPGSRRTVEALERLGAPQACIHFYAEHIEADAVHEQVMRREVVAGLLEQEPGLAADVVFGVVASDILETRLTTAVLDAWRSGRSSLEPINDHSALGVG